MQAPKQERRYLNPNDNADKIIFATASEEVKELFDHALNMKEEERKKLLEADEKTLTPKEKTQKIILERLAPKDMLGAKPEQVKEYTKRKLGIYLDYMQARIHAHKQIKEWEKENDTGGMIVPEIRVKLLTAAEKIGEQLKNYGEKQEKLPYTIFTRVNDTKIEKTLDINVTEGGSMHYKLMETIEPILIKHKIFSSHKTYSEKSGEDKEGGDVLFDALEKITGPRKRDKSLQELQELIKRDKEKIPPKPTPSPEMEAALEKFKLDNTAGGTSLPYSNALKQDEKGLG